MNRGLSRAVRRLLVLVPALGGLALAVPSLAAANPACGKVVTSNVTLHSNMVCTNTNDPTFAALFVGKNGITINLNGFSIQGNGTVAYGIDNAGDWGPSAPGSGGGSGPGTGFNNVTVENGNITNNSFGQYTGFYDAGIYGSDVTSMHVSNMNVYGMKCEGLTLFDANTSSVTGSHFGNQSNPNGCDGAYLYGNAALTISNSTFDYNNYAGIDDSNSQATLNGVQANHNNQDGVDVGSPVAPYLIENSTANGNLGFAGFDVYNNEFNTVTFKNNRAENNTGWGYWSESHSKGGNNDYENDGSGGCHNVGGCFLSS